MIFLTTFHPPSTRTAFTRRNNVHRFSPLKFHPRTAFTSHGAFCSRKCLYHLCITLRSYAFTSRRRYFSFARYSAPSLNPPCSGDLRDPSAYDGCYAEGDAYRVSFNNFRKWIYALSALSNPDRSTPSVNASSSHFPGTLFLSTRKYL